MSHFVVGKAWVFVRNVRLAQFVFFVVVLAIGVATAVAESLVDLGGGEFGWQFAQIGVLLVAIWLAWAGSVALNDVSDVEIDSLTNPTRPLPQQQFTRRQFAQIGYIVSMAALLFAGALSRELGILMGIFIAINYIYNCPPLRLKRILFVGSLLPAMAIQVIAYMGFLVIAPSATLADYPYGVLEVVLAVLVLAFIIPLKDIKDKSSDARYGVHTWASVIGVRATQVMATVAIAVFLVMRMAFMGTLSLVAVAGVASVLAVALGIIWTLEYRCKSRRQLAQNLVAWMMVPALIYSIFLWVIYFA